MIVMKRSRWRGSPHSAIRADSAEGGAGLPQLAGYRAEDGAETDNFNFSAARLKTDTHTHKLPRTFMFGNSISIYLYIMYTLSRSLSISNRSCMRRYIDVDI